MLASEMEDRLGEGVVHANMGTTHEMLSNMEEALVHQEKVSSSPAIVSSQHAWNSVMIVNGAHSRDLLTSFSPPPYSSCMPCSRLGTCTERLWLLRAWPTLWSTWAASARPARL